MDIDAVSNPLLLWVLGSMVIYVFSTNALWLIKDRWHLPDRHWLVQVGRFLFFLGVPYLALGGWPRGPYQGLLALEDMGIVGLDERWPVTRWLEAAGIGLGWGMVALVILVLAWAGANRQTKGLWLRFPSRSWWWILIDGLYLGVHWAFYRSALASALGDLYAGIFAGLGLIYLEWSLNPFWRRDWRLESRAADCWLRATLALVITLLFFLNRNLWVCIAVYWLLGLTLRHAGRGRFPRPGAKPQEIS